MKRRRWGGPYALLGYRYLGTRVPEYWAYAMSAHDKSLPMTTFLHLGCGLIEASPINQSQKRPQPLYSLPRVDERTY